MEIGELLENKRKRDSAGRPTACGRSAVNIRHPKARVGCCQRCQLLAEGDVGGGARPIDQVYRYSRCFARQVRVSMKQGVNQCRQRSAPRAGSHPCRGQSLPPVLAGLPDRLSGARAVAWIRDHAAA